MANTPDREKMAYIRVSNIKWKVMLKDCGIVGVPHRSRIVMGEILSEKFASGTPFTAKQVGDELKARLRTGMSNAEKAAKVVSADDDEGLSEFLNKLDPATRKKLAKMAGKEK